MRDDELGTSQRYERISVAHPFLNNCGQPRGRGYSPDPLATRLFVAELTTIADKMGGYTDNPDITDTGVYVG